MYQLLYNVWFSAAKHALPPEWVAMKDDDNFRIVNVSSSDPIYQRIEKQFVSEVTTGQYCRLSNMKNVKVIKVLYLIHILKKEQQEILVKFRQT